MGEHTADKLKIYFREYCRAICQEAENLRLVEMPRVTEELFALYENTGNRLIYEEVYFLRRKFLAVFGLKAVLSREEEDIRKLEEVIEDVCGEECWALPAHVNRKTDPDWRICVDLFAAETAQTLSEITFLLRDLLSGHTAARAKEEVGRRVLRPFSESKAPYGNWEYNTGNWCAVCGGSIGSAAIYLMQEEPEEPEELEALLDRICCSLENYYLEGFTEDGVCLEGLAYFTYGMTYFAGFAEQLYRYTRGRRDLFRTEKLKKIAAFQSKCYFKSGKTISFADGSAEDTFRPGLTCFLAMKYPGARIPPMECASGLNADSCYRWMALYRNLIWTKLYLDEAEQRQTAPLEAFPEEEPSGTVVLPKAQWLICQSSSGAGMAAKGGDNGEPHNHNDVGSFFYLNGEDFLLADLGCGEYTRDYFSEKRYGYLCCRSLGHNVPLVDGGEQLPGKEYGCSRFESNKEGRTEISFAGAYGNPALESLTRILEWDPEEGILNVEDIFETTGNLKSIRENLVTQWQPEIEGSRIWIQGRKRACLVIVEGEGIQISCIPVEFSDHGGARQDVWLLQWEVPLPKGAGRVKARFTVLPEAERT